MEEKNITKAESTEAAKTEKLSYEQLEKVALQLQGRVIAAENKLKSLDFASIRLTWLFKVIENEMSFNSEFVNKCAEEITNLLTLEESDIEKETTTD